MLIRKLLVRNLVLKLDVVRRLCGWITAALKINRVSRVSSENVVQVCLHKVVRYEGGEGGLPLTRPVHLRNARLEQLETLLHRQFDSTEDFSCRVCGGASRIGLEH